MCIPSEGRNQAFPHPPLVLSLSHRVIQIDQMKELIVETGGTDRG